MHPPLNATLRGTLMSSFILLVALLVPASARAIQLHWNPGGTDLTVTQNTQAVLLVQADSGEVALPPQWRLLWTADSSGIQFAAMDSAIACLTDTARVAAIDVPLTPADSAANQITAHFCSLGSELATTAYFLVGIVGASHGKLKVVATSLDDTMATTESNEVTYNGGVTGDYAPTLLTASRIHQGDQFLATARGVGLSRVTEVAVQSPLGAWSAPLTIIEQTDTTLVASAFIAAPLPDAVLRVTSPSGAVSSPTLPADELMAPQAVPPYASYVDASRYVRPKDFAFFYDGMGHFHLFYIRHNTGLCDTNPAAAALNERSFAHVSGDLSTWSSQDTSFTTGAHGWDKAHVWAPYVLQNGNAYFMFYSGVDSVGDERIGYATTTNVNTAPISWQRFTTPLFGAENAPWALQTHPRHCRDPFVMKDPSDNTRWLMYYTTNTASMPEWQTIGIARSAQNSLTVWTDYGPMLMADDLHNYSIKQESPHVFPHTNSNGSVTWWTFFTTDMYIMSDRNESSPIDTTQSGPQWDHLNYRLYDHLTGHDPRVQYWNGSEYLNVPARPTNDEYIAGYNAAVVDPCGTVVNADSNGIWIQEILWRPGPGGARDTFSLTAGVSTAAVPPATLEQFNLQLTGPHPGGRVSLAVRLPTAQNVRLEVYDVLGRHIRTLVNGRMLAGATTVAWDGRGPDGRHSGSGIYFARLICGAGTRSVRFPILL